MMILFVIDEPKNVNLEFTNRALIDAYHGEINNSECNVIVARNTAAINAYGSVKALRYPTVEDHHREYA